MRKLIRKSISAGLVAVVCAGVLSTGSVSSAAVAPGTEAGGTSGTVLRVNVRSTALTGNLAGDSPVREVSIYLPPGYRQNPHRRYPVLYMLHGFTQTDRSYFGESSTNIPVITDRAIAAGAAQQMIIVTPNAMTIYGGSNYSSGATTGDWETFISQELVSYVDRKFRTIPRVAARGLAGHSMGGYGAMRIGMKHPDVFSSLYILSACCISPTSNIPDTPDEIAQFEAFTTRPSDYTQIPASIRTAVAAAAAWAPNPQKPPLYYDSPVQGGTLNAAVFARMTANRPLAMIDQYIGNLRQQRIAFDVGDEDTNIRANLTEFDRILTAYQIPHSFEIYPGNHGNRIPERFETKVLPFFARHLSHSSR